MKSYSAIFIPKINNKLKKIIKGIELLNLINSQINIQIGGSGSVAETFDTLVKKTVFVYNTEEYEKMVAKFQKEIALFRAIIIELLSRLPQTKSENAQQFLGKEKAMIKSLLEPPKIEPPKIKLPKIEPPKIKLPKELTKDELFMNTLTLVYEDKGKEIKIYKFTQDTYTYIDSEKFKKDTLWSDDINKTQNSKYKKENMKDIYILFAEYNDNSKYLFSFKHNDLRDMKNNQLKLEELYNDLCDNKDDCNKLRVWFMSEIKEYVNSPKIESTTEPRSGTTPRSSGSENYIADSCERYNIIFKNNITNYPYIHLKITDNNRQFNNTTQRFESIPFYVDIYDFISNFTNINTITITGDFKKDFDITYKKYISSESGNTFKIDITHTMFMNHPIFNNIIKLICNNINIIILNTIINLFKLLEYITITGRYDIGKQQITIKEVIQTSCKIVSLTNISFPKDFKAIGDSVNECKSKNIQYID